MARPAHSGGAERVVAGVPVQRQVVAGRGTQAQGRPVSRALGYGEGEGDVGDANRLSQAGSLLETTTHTDQYTGPPAARQKRPGRRGVARYPAD